MRKLLYLSPYFPPQSKVGALRPLKFVRHLRAFGWDPIVLTDLRPSDRRDEELCRALPPELEVVYDYSFFASHPAVRETLRGWFYRPTAKRPRAVIPQKQLPAKRRLALGTNPEWFPLGGHAFDMSHAVRAGSRILKDHDCSAIFVNADPYATLLVGQHLSQRHGIPWIADLRDPWSVCELRRPKRPALQRSWVDHTEAKLIQSSSAYIVNTDQTREAYRNLFGDVTTDKLHVIRNHVDPELFEAAPPQRWPGFSLVFFGTFRRFLGVEPIVACLSRLERARKLPSEFRLHVVGEMPAHQRRAVTEAGLGNRVQVHAPLSYVKAQTLLRGADLLLSLGHETDQRIPAKIFDYLASGRPILHLGNPNAELEHILTHAGGVDFCPFDQPEHLDRVLALHLARGRQPDVTRSFEEFTSRTAARRLAKILDGATHSSSQPR